MTRGRGYSPSVDDLIDRALAEDVGDGDLTTRINAPAAYVVKLVTVTVRPTAGPFPGLRRTTQSLYLRVRDAM